MNIIRAKCLVLGDCAVGKTAFINTFMGDGSQYIRSYLMTLGVDIHQKQIRIPETNTATQLYFFDCSGKEYYRSLVMSVSDQTSMVFLVYDVTSEESFKKAETLYQQVKSNIEGNAPLKGVLLAHKVDLTSRRRISPKTGHELAQKLGLTYFEGSAKEGKGIEAPFYFLANEWYKIYSESAQSLKLLQP